jgi:hypothetical protein
MSIFTFGGVKQTKLSERYNRPESLVKFTFVMRDYLQMSVGQGLPRYSQIYEVSDMGTPLRLLPSAAKPRFGLTPAKPRFV